MPVLNSQNSFYNLQCTLMLVLISASLWLECASAACPRVPWCWRHISVDARMWLCITWGKFSVNLLSRLLSYLPHEPRSLGTRLNSWSVFSLPSAHPFNPKPPAPPLREPKEVLWMLFKTIVGKVALQGNSRSTHRISIKIKYINIHKLLHICL